LIAVPDVWQRADLGDAENLVIGEQKGVKGGDGNPRLAGKAALHGGVTGIYRGNRIFSGGC